MTKGCNEKDCTVHAIASGIAAVILSEAKNLSIVFRVIQNQAGQESNELHRTLHELSATNVCIGAKDPSPDDSG